MNPPLCRLESCCPFKALLFPTALPGFPSPQSSSLSLTNPEHLVGDQEALDQESLPRYVPWELFPSEAVL